MPPEHARRYRLYGGDDQRIMVEYGNLLGDPPDTIFRSRLTEAHLSREAAVRAAEAGAVLDRYGGEDTYGAFLRRYTPVTDPMLHEARVHLFRRDRYLRHAPDVEDADLQRKYWATAHLENRILERWFGPVLHASSHRWPEGRAAEVERFADGTRLHDSWVSRHLITAYEPWQAALALGTLTAGLLLAARRLEKTA